MSPDDFKQIEAYFAQHNAKHLAPKAYALYVDNVRDGAKNQPSQAITKKLCQSYLTDAQMKSYLSVAQKEWEAENKDKPRGLKSFSYDVGVSIFANFLFVLLLYLLFVLATSPGTNEMIDKMLGRGSQVAQAGGGGPKELLSSASHPASSDAPLQITHTPR